MAVKVTLKSWASLPAGSGLFNAADLEGPALGA